MTSIVSLSASGKVDCNTSTRRDGGKIGPLVHIGSNIFLSVFRQSCRSSYGFGVQRSGSAAFLKRAI